MYAAVDVLFFFFQAEDGIRDIGVTGVQTCALPICTGSALPEDLVLGGLGAGADDEQVDVDVVRAGERPGDAVGDVLGDQRLPDAAVDGVGRVLRPQPVAGELVGAHHSRRDHHHPHRPVVE